MKMEYLLRHDGRDSLVLCLKKKEINAPVLDSFIPALDRKLGKLPIFD
jgi:hypothetical protein